MSGLGDQLHASGPAGRAGLLDGRTARDGGADRWCGGSAPRPSRPYDRSGQDVAGQLERCGDREEAPRLRNGRCHGVRRGEPDAETRADERGAAADGMRAGGGASRSIASEPSALPTRGPRYW